MKISTLVGACLASMTVAGAVVWIVTPPGGAGPLVAAASAREAPLVVEIQRDAPLAHYRLRERAIGEPVRDEIRGLDGVHAGSMTEAFFTHPELVVPSGPFTVEAWVRPRVFDDKHRGIVDVEWPASPNGVQGYRMYTSRQGGVPTITFGRIARSMTHDVVTPFPDDGRIHHVVGAHDGGVTVCLTLDAERRCTVDAPVPIVGRGSAAAIGRRIFSVDQPFLGEIRDVAFYDKDLPERRVAEHLHAGPP